MKTARELGHELAAGIVPACYSMSFDDGDVIEHSHHCDFLTTAFEARDRETRAAALREAADIAETRGEVDLRQMADRAERGE